MLIREKQLNLFEDPAPDMLGGVPTCSMEHPKPKRAKYRVYFKNGTHHGAVISMYGTSA